ERYIGHHCVHDSRSILACFLVAYIVVKILDLVVLPACNLVYAAAGIFVKGNVITLDKLGVLGLDEEVVVLCVMLAGLGAVIAESSDIFISGKVAVVRYAAFKNLNGPLSDFGIEVGSV